MLGLTKHNQPRIAKEDNDYQQTLFLLFAPPYLCAWLAAEQSGHY